MNPLPLLLICIAGWMNRDQQVVIEYLQEESAFSKSNWEDALNSMMTSAAHQR